MVKKMKSQLTKKILSFTLSLALVLSLGVFSTFASASRDEYLAKYDEYVTYYEGTYVPSYNSYNAALSAFAARVEAVKNELTADQFVRIVNFLKDIKARRTEFFGDRVTPGKSRYEVPFYRDAMMAAAEDGNYDLALTNRTELVAKVKERVDFLGGLTEQLDTFDLKGGTAPTVPAISADFVVTSDNGYGYTTLQITLTNNSSAPVSGWDLSFTYKDGVAYSFWFKDGSGNNTKIKGEDISIKPTSSHNPSYTIEPGQSIVILGTGGKSGTGITNAKLDGQSITMTFSK